MSVESHDFCRECRRTTIHTLLDDGSLRCDRCDTQTVSPSQPAAEFPIARIARTSWWRRLAAWFRSVADERSRAELLTRIEHQESIIAAQRREIERLKAKLPERPFLWTQPSPRPVPDPERSPR